MNEARLTPAIEASALLALANAHGGFGAVLQKGDADRGSLMLLLLERGRPISLLQRVLGRDGCYAWESRQAADSESLEQHVARARSRDPDLWVLELDVPSTERFIAEMIATA